MEYPISSEFLAMVKELEEASKDGFAPCFRYQGKGICYNENSRMFREGRSKVLYPAIWKRDPETGEPTHAYREFIPEERGYYEVMVVHDQKKEEWYCEVWRKLDQSTLRIKNGKVMHGPYQYPSYGSSD